jgi:phosphoribosylglycinamide formyltransferase-1
MTTPTKEPVKIQIWASGSGSNAENLIRFFNHTPSGGIIVDSVMTDNPQAGVINRCNNLDVPIIITDAESRKSTNYLPLLQDRGIDYIVLAGYLRKVAPTIIRAFLGRIVNIHPSLLPKYGGKGMYGEHVHRAVLSNGEHETGISIHVVDEEYDRGPIIDQFKVKLDREDDLNSVKTKISALEMQHFPKTLKKFIVGTNNR